MNIIDEGDGTIKKYLKSFAFVLLYIGIYIIISAFIGVVFELLYVFSQMLNNSGGLDAEAL